MNLTFWHYVGLIGIFSLVTFVVLFGSLPKFKSTWISKLRNALLTPLFLLQILDNRLFGGRVTKLYASQGHVLLWSVPIGYVILVLCCLYGFFRDCFPRMPNSWHKSVLVPFFISLDFYATGMAVLSDPGFVTQENLQKCLAETQYDFVTFVSGQVCKTCKLAKPARSKHCSSCGHCVRVCDHHCIWINNCVGSHNYRWFLLFVVANFLMLSYGAIVTWKILHPLVKADLFGTKGLGNVGSLFDRWFAAITSSRENRTCGCIMLLSMLLSPLCLGFLLEHLRLIYVGCTTNETAKWEAVKDCMEDGSLWIYPDSDRKAHSMILRKRNDGTFNRALSVAEQRRVREKNLKMELLTSMESVNNIYDKGFGQNFADRVFGRRF